MTRSLDIMMATATEATMTMAVAAEKPPMNVASDSQETSCDNGNNSTNWSPIPVPP